MKQIDLKELFTTLDAKKNEFAEIVGGVKTMLGNTNMTEDDKEFFEDAINKAMTGKDFSIDLVNKRVKDLNNGSRVNHSE